MMGTVNYMHEPTSAYNLQVSFKNMKQLYCKLFISNTLTVETIICYNMSILLSLDGMKGRSMSLCKTEGEFFSKGLLITVKAINGRWIFLRSFVHSSVVYHISLLH